jgi:hypothetical protein
MRNDHDRTARRLTHDELKAAESAFQGWAFNDAWSEAALAVYMGIANAKTKLNYERLTPWGRPACRHPLGAAEPHGVLA